MRRHENHPLFLILFLSLGFVTPLQARSNREQPRMVHPEVERVRGFDEHQKEKREAERDRERGLQIHLEQIEIEKRAYAKAVEEYRKQKKTTKPLEETPAYKTYLTEKAANEREAEKFREEFKVEKREEARLRKQANLDPMRELYLPEDRPRFDVKNRTLYGAESQFGKGGFKGGGRIDPGSGDTGGGFSSPGYNPPENTFTPPGFDEFPPPPIEDNFDLPPPPPLPPMDGDLGPPDDFFPPPPPPPPPMEDYQF